MAYSFYRTSKNIKIEVASHGTYLEVEALNEDQNKYFHTSIGLDDFIGNDNGNFVWGGKDFTKTAKNIKLSFDKNGVPLLHALLKDSEGKEHDSVLDLSLRIVNKDGELGYVDSIEKLDG